MYNFTSHGYLRTFAAKLLALLMGLLVASQAALAGTVTYYHYDAQGNPVMASNAAGEIIWRKHFAPYGEELNGVPDDLGYTGHEYDQETGLTYMQARYFDPISGRFYGIDPAGFDPNQPMTFNRYSYANNNPYKYTDPNGESVDTIIDVGYVVYDAGQFLGAATAAGVGAVTGDQYLQNAGLEGMQATGIDLGASAVSLAVPGLSAPMIRGGVKVVDAAGDVTKGASHAATNRAGNVAKGIPESQLGPSGKPKIHKVDHGGKRGEAKEAARRDGGKSGSVVNHTNPQKGKDHYHGNNKSGEKSRVHHEYDP